MYKSATLEPQLAMGSEPYQLQRICIRIAIDQHEIGAETVIAGNWPNEFGHKFGFRGLVSSFEIEHCPANPGRFNNIPLPRH